MNVRAAAPEGTRNVVMRYGIRLQLLVAFGAVLVLPNVVGIIAWRSNLASASAIDDVYGDELVQIQSLGAAERATYQLNEGALGDAYVNPDPVERATILAGDTQRMALIDDSIQQFAASNPSPEETALLRTWQQAYAAFVPLRQQVIALVDANRIDEAAALRTSVTALSANTLTATLEKLQELQVDSANAKRADNAAATSSASRQLLIGSLAAIVLVVLVAGLFSRHIVNRLAEVGRAAAGLAQGNLDQTINVHSRDEIGQLADAFREMVSRSRATISGIQSGAADLSSASSEILAAVAQQSSGTSEQSAAIVQTTATVEQVKASAEQAVQMAMIVSGNAREASRVAGVGVQAAQDAAEGMADLREKVESIAGNILSLSEQSQKIAEIISTVNDLADQSNLLALNAAIEASRAGEQGKGFSVVATEIRNLAEQSKGATSQVRTILSDIQTATNATVLSTEQGTRGVDTGMRLVDQTGKTIGELAVIIEQASESTQQIAASIRQHSVGMEQIASAMANINQASAQNLEATSDTRKAAENLTRLAGGLKQAAGQYRI